MNKDYLKYDVYQKKYQIESELDKTRIQLGFIENKLKDMTDSIKIYWGFIIAPPVCSILLVLISTFLMFGDALAMAILYAIAFVISLVWIPLFPYSVYHLIKYNLFKKVQDKSESSVIAPPPVRNPIEVLNKPSKQTLYTGFKMTEWKVFRYTYYLDEIGKMLTLLEGDPDEAAMQDISDKLASYVLYVDIEPLYELPKEQTRIYNVICALIVIIPTLYGFVLFYRFLLLLRR